MPTAFVGEEDSFGETFFINICLNTIAYKLPDNTFMFIKFE